jgi:hypothetical protein
MDALSLLRNQWDMNTDSHALDGVVVKKKFHSVMHQC